MAQSLSDQVQHLLRTIGVSLCSLQWVLLQKFGWFVTFNCWPTYVGCGAFVTESIVKFGHFEFRAALLGHHA